MRIISFAWTTPALLVRPPRKTVTRREWSVGYAALFARGDLVQAYSRNPRWNGRPVATIRLTRDPYPESTRYAPEEDFEAEGFAYLEEIGAKVDGLTPRALWRAWHLHPQDLWVIRFEVVRVSAVHAPKPATPQLALPMGVSA